MNIPATKLDQANNIMIVGLGGGFDVFTGLPFVYHYPDKKFILVNSESAVNNNKMIWKQTDVDDYPHGRIYPVDNIIGNYTVGRNGSRLVRQAYVDLIEKNNIDFILAVDGGVDSLMVGDEDEAGTILEDFIAIAALADIKIDKILCCAGFGTETEENLNHYRVLENIAQITTEGGFLGSFSLTKSMPEYSEYKKQCEFCWGKNGRKSHIQTKIISSIEGNFKNNLYTDVDPKLVMARDFTFVSPLSSLFWMFDFNIVADRNKLIHCLKSSTLFSDSQIMFRINKSELNKRSKEIIPL